MTLFKNSLTIFWKELRSSINATRSLSVVILIIAPLFSAFREPAEKGTGTTVRSSIRGANETYVIDQKESVVTWKGSMAFGKGEHIGYVSISKGELLVEKGQLVGGSAILDMTTITDKIHGSDNGLINHLKDPDFFDVKKFPISGFAITKVATIDATNIHITGNLTIKNITHEITFPAKVEVNKGVVNANGKVTIDRTKWDVRYKSGKFYDNLADEAIADDIEFEMKIVAKKA